jgi:hypothetical protein
MRFRSIREFRPKRPLRSDRRTEGIATATIFRSLLRYDQCAE